MNKEKNALTKKVIRKKVIRTTYSEIKLDGGEPLDRNYKNPLTGRFQYEYALFRAVSDLFFSVKCQSLCIESLKLYFRELPLSSKKEDDPDSASSEKKRKTQESLLAEASMLVSRDVVSHITFPQINVCQAEVNVLTEKDGSHTFLFSDGVYGFTVHMELPRKGKPKSVAVRDLSA